jgi:hypothetical protein
LRLTVKASRGGRFVGPAEADGLDEGDDGVEDVPLDVALGDGVVDDGVVDAAGGWSCGPDSSW